MARFIITAICIAVCCLADLCQSERDNDNPDAPVTGAASVNAAKVPHEPSPSVTTFETKVFTGLSKRSDDDSDLDDRCLGMMSSMLAEAQVVGGGFQNLDPSQFCGMDPPTLDADEAATASGSSSPQLRRYARRATTTSWDTGNYTDDSATGRGSGGTGVVLPKATGASQTSAGDAGGADSCPKPGTLYVGPAYLDNLPPVLGPDNKWHPRKADNGF